MELTSRLSHLRATGILDPPNRFHPWSFVWLVIVGGAIILASCWDMGYLVPAGIVGLWFVFWSFRRPVVASSVIIFLYLHLLNKDEGVTPAEVAFVVYAFGYLVFWLFKTILVERRPVFRSSADFFLCVFFGICIVSGVVTLAWDGTLFLWFRETMSFAQLLLYFPLRDAMKSKRDAVAVMIAAGVMIGCVAAYGLANYRSASVAVRYMWELLSNRRAFGDHMFFPATVVVMSLLVHARTYRMRIVMSLVLLVFGLALAMTFSRGFWIATACGFLVLFAAGENRVRVNFLIAMSVTIMLAATAIFSFIGAVGGSVLQLLVTRFSSAGAALTDISVLNRLAETRALLELIPESPIIGHGVGMSFSFYNIIYKVTSTVTYAHNGYLFLLFKVGLAGTIALLGFIMMQIRTAAVISRSVVKDDFIVGVVRGVGAAFVAMLLVTVTSNVFVERQSIAILVVGSAFLSSSAAVTRQIQHVRETER